MKHNRFERLMLTAGTVIILGTVAISLRDAPPTEEIVAQVLLLVVLVGAVHWGRRGGLYTAIAASGVYILMRIPMFVEQGELTSDLLIMILSRAAMYGLVGILGGSLCQRIKYYFAQVEDGASLDPTTGVYSRHSLARIIRVQLGEYERYDVPCSVVVITLEGGLTESLRPSRRKRMRRRVADRIRDDIRLVDDVGRLEDGRFVAVFRHTTREGGRAAAKRLRSAIRDLLGAREGSVTVEVFAVPGDVERLERFAGSLGEAPPGERAERPQSDSASSDAESASSDGSTA